MDGNNVPSTLEALIPHGARIMAGQEQEEAAGS